MGAAQRVEWSSRDPVVSVIMPAFNEEACIRESVRQVVRALNGSGYDYEVIVVDDGSIDGTRETVVREQNPDVRVVGYRVNQGKGYALRYGFRFARGERVVFLDSDAEVGVETLQRYVVALDGADLAVASKWHPASRVEVPAMRRFLSYGFWVLVKLLTGVKVSDTQAGLKACRASALDRLLPLVLVKKYAFDVELLTVAQLLGMRVAELPVAIQLRRQFKVKAVVRMLVDVLGIAYRLRVKRWYQANMSNHKAK